MRIDLPYGDSSKSVILPTGIDVDHISRSDITGIEDIPEQVAHVCRSPLESAPLKSRLRPDGRVLIVTSDLTRSGGMEMLPVVVDHLVTLGVDKERISILIGRGAHRSLSKAERKFLRAGALKQIEFAEHDCDDASSHSALVFTGRGTPVRVNRAVRESGLVILLSGVSFHYFAGYGGGRKLILPGCADRGSIEANHRLSLTDTHPVQLHPGCRPANLEGNPVHEDMTEAVAALNHLFAINFFCDTSGRVAFINAGDPVNSHLEACRALSDQFEVRLPAPARVIIASAGGWPYDMNLLQAHKGLCHAAQAATADATILYHAECREGIGSKSLEAALSKPADKFLAEAYTDYGLNNQAAVSLHRLTEKRRVAMVTELDGKTLEGAGIEYCENAEAFIAEALERHGVERIAVIRFGSQILPQS